MIMLCLTLSEMTFSFCMKAPLAYGLTSYCLVIQYNKLLNMIMLCLTLSEMKLCM